MLKPGYLIIVLSFLLATGKLAAEEPDWSHYQALLKHVNPGVKNNVSLMLVDYKQMNGDGSLDKVYQDISLFDLERLSGRNEKLAFYINAYNILALKMIADNLPIDSIKDAGSFFSPVWDKPAGMLGGKLVTLGEIEHKILRPMGEPRVHFAIVCASVSCPDLRNEMFTALKLDQQLNDQVQHFLNNQGKGLKIENNVIRVSKIFDWFEEDFDGDGGISSFITHYRTDLPKFRIKANLAYDWSVNAVN